MNYGDIIDFVLTDNMFSSVAGIMEYDKALKEKTEYRKFIKDQAKLRQVVLNPSLSHTTTPLLTLLSAGAYK